MRDGTRNGIEVFAYTNCILLVFVSSGAGSVDIMRFEIDVNGIIEYAK